MKDKLNTLRTLPEDKALAIFERYMREQWDEGFKKGMAAMYNAQELLIGQVERKPMSYFQEKSND